MGLATAYRMQERYPDCAVTLLEKDADVGRHQSSHNSGVLHCGLAYRPGSRKARLAVRGVRQMIAFCREHGIAHDVCGKVVVATEEDEIPRLKTLFERGTANGLQGLRWLSGDELREIEPNAAGIAAVRVPEEGIADYPGVSATLARLIEAKGGRVIRDAEVTFIHRESAGWLVLSKAGSFIADVVVTCAGLYSDRVAELAGHRREVQIVPFRGEYYKIRPEREGLIKHLIYPVPDPAFPFLGVHFTRMIRGGVECGPNAVLATAREGYSKRDFRPGELADALMFPGLWAFLAKYPGMCWQETRRSFSRDLFCRTLQRLVPAIQPDDLVEGGAGVRAQAMYPNGGFVEDFHILEGPGELHVVNAPSPGATSSLALGEEIVDMLALQ